MESPVRICLGAVLVVNILLHCSTPAQGIALPNDITSTTLKDDLKLKPKLNITRTVKSRNTPDISLNELNPKIPASEEHTEKNAKYKDRGRVRFGAQFKATEPPRKAETPSLIIVTPTPELKKPAQIIDSMRSYKKTKMPALSSSTTPVSAYSSESVQEYDEREAEESKESYEKYTSRKFQDSFFTAPSFDGYDFNHDTENDKNRVKYEYNSSPFTSEYFPKDSDKYKEDKDPFKSSFFDFDSELTTPKNDFFDNKYRQISSSIINKLDKIRAKNPPRNVTNVHNFIENIGLERLSNNTPSNKSSVFIKNTKEIRMRDNESAGSSNKELSDVHGTSVYYEMSVLSTETYTINHSNEDDCDDATVEPTVKTLSEETSSLKATVPTVSEATSKATILKPNEEILSTIPSTFLPYSTVIPIPVSTQNLISTETPRLLNYRNRNYSKRLNLTGDSNSVTPKSEVSTGRTQSRKFHHTTRAKPVWMSPRGNLTRIKSSTPMTIYSEYFNIKDKLSTAKPRSPTRTVLTTVSSSEIDPVQQIDVSGIKKIVHSQPVKDNSIPSLRKRGSMKFATSTASSAELESEFSELEIPSTAWSLASLISLPSLPSPVNVTENELQKVGDVTDKKGTTTSSTTTPTPISNEIITKKLNDLDQNKLQTQSVYVSSTPNHNSQVEKTDNRTPKPNEVTTESTKDNIIDTQVTKEVKPLWLPNAIETTSAKNVLEKTIPPVDDTRSTGFESITKLPSDVTTPQDEVVASSELNQTVADEKPVVTTDYEITTIRFSYIPTEPTEDSLELNTETTNPDMHSVPTTETTTPDMHSVPTRTSTSEEPITTYRPKYMTTTESIETTTNMIETTPVLEVSSQIVSDVTDKPLETTMAITVTETVVTTTEDKTQHVITTEEATVPTVVTTIPTTTIKLETTQPTTTEPTTTTVAVETTTTVDIVTEINTEKVTVITTTEATTTESEENSDSNEIIHDTKTTTLPETTRKNEPITSSVIEIGTEPTTESSRIIESTTDGKTVNDLEDESRYAEMTTEASSRVLPEEAGSGAAIAIAVSTIGVIAMILLIGLLVVVRRRGRRGVYAQRCTPVSLDAYSLDSVSVGHRKGNQRLRASKRSYGNPAYDDEVTSHPMHYPALASFAMDIESITAEFAEIPTVTVRPEEVPPGCEDKNRYSNVLPLPETRVPLKRIGNDPTTEYINANYVTGPGNIKNYYILCQAPLSNTVTDFWRMIWEQNSRLIVMLTEYMENGVEKCYEYLPPSEISDNKRVFGDFKVVLKKREQRDKYAISSVQLINMATMTWREVTHLWYFWPAKGVPEDYDSVIDFLFEMRNYMKVAQTAKEFDEEGVEVIYGDRSSFNNLSKLKSDDNGSTNGVNVYSPAKAEEQMRRNANNGTLSRMKAASEVEGIRPCVLVCASGAGRSGALAALEVCARALSAAAPVDVPRAVRRLRAQRPHALSNRQHYIFLYKVLSEYGNKIMGNGDNI